MEIWYLICCKPEQDIKQAVELLVIWDAVTPVWNHCSEYDIVNWSVEGMNIDRHDVPFHFFYLLTWLMGQYCSDDYVYTVHIMKNFRSMSRVDIRNVPLSTTK